MSVIFSTRKCATGAYAPTSGLLKVTAVLCQSFQENHALGDALRQAAVPIDADIASISRVDLRCEYLSAKVISHRVSVPQSGIESSFDVSFASAICGDSLHIAKAGSLWIGGLKDLDDHDALSAIYQSNRLSQSVSILLERQNGKADFLEFHFGHHLPAALVDNLCLLGPLLSECWRNRALGRFSEAKLATNNFKAAPRLIKDILSVENPCLLSRAEFRVCSLLARGLNNKVLLSELSITMATLRTHLRNIYAKTGTSSQSELIHFLLSPTVKYQSMSLGHAHVA